MAIAASPIASVAIIVISSSFTCMRSKHRHHAAGFASGCGVRRPFA
jgi:hypothetical protein